MQLKQHNPKKQGDAGLGAAPIAQPAQSNGLVNRRSSVEIRFGAPIPPQNLFRGGIESNRESF